jgi:geranylgeranyl pyrophosphate synthase
LLAMADEEEVEDTTAELTCLGGRAQAKPFASETVTRAEQALRSVPAATEASVPMETPPESSSGNE